MANQDARVAPAKGLRIALWLAQALLALFFLMAGVNHGILPVEQAAQRAPWVTGVPFALLRFIGFAELAGAVGLVLPAATRIAPRLTPFAALGVMTIMLLAIPFHLSRGETFVAMHAIVAALAAFVAWGRFKAAPIAPRTRG